MQRGVRALVLLVLHVLIWSGVWHLVARLPAWADATVVIAAAIGYVVMNRQRRVRSR